MNIHCTENYKFLCCFDNLINLYFRVCIYIGKDSFYLAKYIRVQSIPCAQDPQAATNFSYELLHAAVLWLSIFEDGGCKAISMQPHGGETILFQSTLFSLEFSVFGLIFVLISTRLKAEDSLFSAFPAEKPNLPAFRINLRATSNLENFFMPRFYRIFVYFREFQMPVELCKTLSIFNLCCFSNFVSKYVIRVAYVIFNINGLTVPSKF